MVQSLNAAWRKALGGNNQVEDLHLDFFAPD
jgi:hypothetical protein